MEINNFPGDVQLDLEYIKLQKDGHTVYQFEGAISYDAQPTLDKLLPTLEPVCTFDFKNIKTIDSYGVRSWIGFMRAAKEKSKIVFDNCTPEIVQQINMIPEFFAGAEINSVIAKYFCSNCPYDELKVFQRNENMPRDPYQSIPKPKCTECQSEMEMDCFEDEFFNWLEAS